METGKQKHLSAPFAPDRGPGTASFESEGAVLEHLSREPWEGPAILLVDLDAFFASVEQLDHPGWRGKPVIVGGDGDKRGVVSTASYEARAFGVHSAMASSVAERLCPDAIWTGGNFARYREVSNAVMEILWDETPHVQQVSIDEAFLDVTPTAINREHPVEVALRIQRRVAQLGVTCSIGVGTSKSVAKIASDRDKPRGLTVVFPGSEANFLDPLPTKALSGVGPSTQSKLRALGIETLGDLRRADEGTVVRRLGQVGQMLLDRVHGREDAAVVPNRETKSISSETSFSTDIDDRQTLLAAIDAMAAKVGRRVRRQGLRGRTLTLKVRYHNLGVRTCRQSLPQASDDEYAFMELLHPLLDELWEEGMGLRLVGVALSGLMEEETDEPCQLSLFQADQCDGEGGEEEAARERRALGRRLQGVADQVKERFGEDSLVYGRDLRLKGASTGSSSKNPADYHVPKGHT